MGSWIDSIKERAKPGAEALRLRMRQRAQVGLVEPDYAFRERCVGAVERVMGYFDPEVRGLSRIPVDRPYLLIGNHSGGMYTPDAWILLAAIYRYHGARTALRPLAHNILFNSPLAPMMRRVGVLSASPDNARAALAAGEGLLIYPGGDYEAYRPYSESQRIDFAQRKGFIRLALRAGVPVIPVTTHGSNESVVTVSRGEWLARVTGFSKITRVKVLPWGVGFPFGLHLAGIPHVPLPSKITIEVGEPMAWDAFSAEDADDDEVVQALYDDVVSTMQRTLDGLYRERPNPYAARTQRTARPQHTPAPVPPAIAPSRDSLPPPTPLHSKPAARRRKSSAA